VKTKASDRGVAEVPTMTVIENQVFLSCTPEEAFDFLSDHRAELEWNPQCQSMEKLTEGPVGLGTRYRAKWRTSPVVELETVAYDRPRSWTMHNEGSIEVTFTCHLDPLPGGTQMHVTFEPTPHGWLRLVFPVFLVILRRQEKHNMGLIKSALERRVNAGPA
jgi:Polyketide cyclase / dehydrase and lipid transport